VANKAVDTGGSMELGDIKDLERFCKRWQSKADEYDLDTLAGTFDQFFSLFVAYNRLYAAAARRLTQTGRIKVQDETDRKSATSHVVEYLGSNKLANILRECTHDDVDRVYELIDNGTFFVHGKSRNDEPDHVRDRQCLRKIKNGDDKDYCTAILALIYTTRCNMFHGSKQYCQVQQSILIPMNSILRCLIDAVSSTLIQDLSEEDAKRWRQN
jgi:hypothetical protein